MSDLRRHSRFITAHNADGKAVFSDAVPSEAPIRKVMGGDMEFSLMFTTKGFPVSMNKDQDIETYKGYLENAPKITIPNGTVCRTVDFPPGYTSPMHRTQSCDFGVVIEGDIELILDSGETRQMKKGDVAVQRGTNHAWKNAGKDTWARMLYVLQESEEVMVGDKPLVEDEGGID